MIRIIKGNPPAILTKKGKMLTTKMKRQFSMNVNDYVHGKMKFKFESIYNNKSIVNALRKAQYNKCCFSESRFAVDYPHVEHFRPKGRIDDRLTKRSTYPGYYWLAYEWSNLFLCKSIINGTYKRNYFPLVDDAKRNKSHHDKNIEIGLLVDPAEDDPRDHIHFYKDEPIGITDRGKCTIDIVGLRHSTLEEERRSKFLVMEAMKNVVDILLSQGLKKDDKPISDLISQLKKLTHSDAEFSSMTTDFLSGWPPLQ